MNDADNARGKAETRFGAHWLGRAERRETGRGRAEGKEEHQQREEGERTARAYSLGGPLNVARVQK